MSLKSGKRKLVVEGGRRGGNKEAERTRGIERSADKSTSGGGGGDRGRSLERGSGGGGGESSRPSVFSRLGTKIQGQGAGGGAGRGVHQSSVPALCKSQRSKFMVP